VRSRVPPRPIITMSLEAARKLSIPELLRVLGEKLDVEYSRVRQTPTPLAGSPEVEVRAHVILQGVTVESDSDPLDRESRNPSPRYPGVHTLPAERVTAGQQVASGDHFLHRSIHLSGGSRRRKTDCSTYSRMPVLARLHHLVARKLDADIQRTEGLGSVESGTRQGGPSDGLPQHEKVEW